MILFKNPILDTEYKTVQKRGNMKKEYRNSARTKRMIREAFVELMSERRALADISISELAERADIAKSTFYNHYDDIYSVAEEMLDELVTGLEGIIDVMGADDKADYRLYVMSFFEFLKQNEETYRKVIFSPDVRLFTDKIKYVIFHRIMSKNIPVHSAKSREQRYISVRCIANSCVDIMVDYYKGEIDMTMDEMAEAIFGLVDKLL